MRKTVYIFFYFLTIRVLFIVVSGFSPNELSSDTVWIDMLSERALTGDFNFDIGRFIVAPFYNVLIAAHKYIFTSNWSFVLICSQLIISSLSGVYFYKLGKLLFNEKAAFYSSLIFGVFPMTLYWVHTFSSESIFQSLLIISIYFLVKSSRTGKYFDVLISAIIFSIVFLTKSHILLFTPFLALFLFLNLSSTKKITFPLLYGLICLLSTLPFGIYNLKHHNQYVLSSNGNYFHFYTGNSEFGYYSIVDVPAKDTKEFKHLKNFNIAHFNGGIHDEIMKKPHNIKQGEYFDLAVDWIKDNPYKFLKLKLYNLGLFLMPGVSIRHYPFKNWLFSLLISLPIYIMGYMGLYQSVKSNYKKHLFALGLLLSMIIFAIVWYVQNRFRTVTLEPIYILYSGIIIVPIVEYLKSFSKNG